MATEKESLKTGLETVKFAATPGGKAEQPLWFEGTRFTVNVYRSLLNTKLDVYA